MEDIDEELENIPEEESPSLAMKIFSCCFQPRGKELELTSENPTSKRSKGIYESDDSFFPVNTLRPEEKAQITFTKNGLLDYIKNLQNLVTSGSLLFILSTRIILNLLLFAPNTSVIN